MTTSKERELTPQHLRIWDEINDLKDGERILGHQIRNTVGIKKERDFYRMIEELRSEVFFIGSSRGYPRGYYPIRTDYDMETYVDRRKAELEKELAALNLFHLNWRRYRRVIPNYMDWPDTEEVEEDVIEEDQAQ